VNDQLHRLALKLIVVSFLNLLLFHGTLSLYFEPCPPNRGRFIAPTPTPKLLEYGFDEPKANRSVMRHH
jgi:hypothetical protein